MDLPKHIADTCGIIMSGPESRAPVEEFKAVKASWDDADQVMTISYRDSVVGWINDANPETGPKYRALSVNGQVKYCYTQSIAMNWLIEEAI